MAQVEATLAFIAAHVKQITSSVIDCRKTALVLARARPCSAIFESNYAIQVVIQGRSVLLTQYHGGIRETLV